MAFGSFGDESGGPAPMAEINTTPLVDVMLVLLVIFIITAPLFQQAVPVDLPRVASTALEERPRVLHVAIDGGGVMHLDGAPIDPDAFGERAASAVRSARADGVTAPELHLRADRDTRHERVTEVMALAQRAGVTRIAFVTAAPAGEAAGPAARPGRTADR